MFWRRDKSFNKAHVCITGGSEGLGLCLALKFVEDGAHVTIISRSKAKLQAAADTLNSHATSINSFSKVTWRSADVSDWDQLKEAIETAKEELGPIGVLVCSAGSAHPGRFVDLDMEVFEAQMKVNFMGTVAATKLVAPDMTKRKSGNIVIVASGTAVVGITGYSAYAPTKWAQRGFADCLRMEMQAHGVSVSIAYPPDMDTEGYAREQKLNPPEIGDMKKAAGDTTYSPQKVADKIILGLKKSRYHLPSPDVLQTLSQSTMASLTPYPFWTPLQMLISAICVPITMYFTSAFDKIACKYVTEPKMTNKTKET